MKFHGRELRFLVGTAAVVTACATGATSVGPITDVVSDEQSLVSVDAAWDYVVVDPVTYATLFPVAPAVFDPAAAAAEATAAAATLFTPATCVQASSSGAAVTYILQSCDGPLSLTDVTGTVTATFVTNTAGPQVQLASTGLSVGSTPVTLAQTATIGSKGTLTTLAVVSDSLVGTMAANSRAFTGTVTWTPGTPCLTIDGSGTEAEGGNTFTVTVNSVQQCSAKCPSTGSVTSTLAGSATTLTFNGTAKVQAVDQNGNSATVVLSCP
jgi:hypothetical protein